jgi:hypothetical protein
MQIEYPTSGVARALRVTRAVPLRRGAIAAITAVACAALASACGSSKSSSESSSGAKTNVDTARVALSIEQSVLTQRHIRAKVVCPATVAAVPRATFECIATSTATKPPHAVTKTPFLVTIQNARGYVTYAGK